MSGKKILIVDDEKAILQTLEKKLAADGYEVFTAMTGQEAMEKILMHRPDIVFMDIILPDIEGSEIASRLQRDPETKRIPIVFLSGIISREKDSRMSSVKVGGWEYRALAKPFTYRDLLDLMAKVFEE